MTWTNTGGGDHEGENWTPTNNTAISGIHTNIGIFTIQTENTIYVASTTWAKWITYDEFEGGGSGPFTASPVFLVAFKRFCEVESILDDLLLKTA